MAVQICTVRVDVRDSGDDLMCEPSEIFGTYVSVEIAHYVGALRDGPTIRDSYPEFLPKRGCDRLRGLHRGICRYKNSANMVYYQRDDASFVIMLSEGVSQRGNGRGQDEPAGELTGGLDYRKSVWDWSPWDGRASAVLECQENYGMAEHHVDDGPEGVVKGAPKVKRCKKERASA